MWPIPENGERRPGDDPTINNLSDARHIMAELLEAEKDHLDPRWFR